MTRARREPRLSSVLESTDRAAVEERSTVVLAFDDLAHHLAETPLARTNLVPLRAVSTHLEVFRLTAKPQVALEPLAIEAPLAYFDPDRATRFCLVATIAVVAPLGRLFDFRECGLHGFRIEPQAELAHTGGIDQAAPAGKNEELPKGGGVPAPSIVLTNL
jgi:hypothetical protein